MSSGSRPQTSPVQPSPASIAARIRRLRRERGWSLADVEKLSRGSVKAVVLGSYERDDRTISINRAIEIAKIFSVPLHFLLAAPEISPPPPAPTSMLLDLRRLRLLMDDPVGNADRTLQMICALVAWLAARRGDWNGEVMSLRQGDHATLALMAMTTEEELSAWLAQNRLLFTEPNHP